VRAPPDVTFKGAIRRALRLRCPVCGNGRPFSGFFEMDNDCSVCSFHFEREPGYFLGAMYVGHFMCATILLPTVVATILLKPPIYIAAVPAFAQIAPLSPLIFRYSRGIWLAVDIVLSPIEPREFSN
jgi:uncharacterized protein (DUF983 family)